MSLAAPECCRVSRYKELLSQREGNDRFVDGEAQTVEQLQKAKEVQCTTSSTCSTEVQVCVAVLLQQHWVYQHRCLGPDIAICCVTCLLHNRAARLTNLPLLTRDTTTAGAAQQRQTRGYNVNGSVQRCCSAQSASSRRAAQTHMVVHEMSGWDAGIHLGHSRLHVLRRDRGRGQRQLRPSS